MGRARPLAHPSANLRDPLIRIVDTHSMRVLRCRGPELKLSCIRAAFRTHPPSFPLIAPAYAAAGATSGRMGHVRSMANGQVKGY